MHLLLLSVLLGACAGSNSEPITETVVQTRVIEQNIPLQSRPDPVNLRSVRFYVVIEENLEEFRSEFLQTNNELVFVVLSIDDYEDLSLNLAELTRYIEQQNSVLVYYETSLN